MTPGNITAARMLLNLSQSQFAALLDCDVTNIQKIERDPRKASSRPAPSRMVRLINAYLSGYRPQDWPK